MDVSFMLLFDTKLSSDLYSTLKFSVTSMNIYWNARSSVMLDNEAYADTAFLTQNDSQNNILKFCTP